MSTKIQETIARLRELDRVASPAPWRTVFDTQIYAGEKEVFEVDASNDDICEWFECSDECGCAGYARKPDINLLVAARNALPDLLTEIDRLTAENQELKRENPKPPIELTWAAFAHTVNAAPPTHQTKRKNQP